MGLPAIGISPFGVPRETRTRSRELAFYWIDVVVIEPGTVKTDMIEKFRTQLESYRQTPYRKAVQIVEQQVSLRRDSAIPVDRIARVIEQAVETKHPRTRYVIPRSRFLGWHLPRLLPDRWLDRVLCRKLGLRESRK